MVNMNHSHQTLPQTNGGQRRGHPPPQNQHAFSFTVPTNANMSYYNTGNTTTTTTSNSSTTSPHYYVSNSLPGAPPFAAHPDRQSSGGSSGYNDIDITSPHSSSSTTTHDAYFGSPESASFGIPVSSSPSDQQPSSSAAGAAAAGYSQIPTSANLNGAPVVYSYSTPATGNYNPRYYQQQQQHQQQQHQQQPHQHQHQQPPDTADFMRMLDHPPYLPNGMNSTATAIRPPKNVHNPNKRAKVNDEDDEEADEDESGMPLARPRPPGACHRCKGLKVKCDYPEGAIACKKCLQSGSDCFIPGRKKRKPPAKREELIKQIKDKDSLITQLLEQLEARSSILAPLSLQAGSPDSSANGINKEGAAAAAVAAPADPASRAAIQAAEEKREREIAEWIKRAKATLLATKDSLLFDHNLLGGEANPLLDKDAPDDEDDEDEGSEYEDGSDNTDQDPHNHTGRGTADGGRTASPTSLSRSGSGSGGGGHGKVKGSALPSVAPFGFLEHMSKRMSRRRSSSLADDDKYGVANPEFFSQSPQPSMTVDSDQWQLPQILSRGIVNPSDVKELFATYFENINLSTCLLDDPLYTPEKTLYRSPFLFTVICAIASRYHPARKDLYPVLMNHARLAAGTALISGRKSLEACQAYILMALYPIPARRWSEDRSWLFLGCAIRMATDLNLHHPPVLNSGRTATTIDTIMELEGQSRSILNRTRAWLSCFNMDKAHSTQFGKPTTLREDWMFPLLQRNMSAGGAEWWCPSPYAAKFDIHLCAYSALLREIAQFHEQIYSDPTNPTGLNENIAFEELTYEFDARIEKMGAEWFHRVDKHMNKNDPQCIFRKGLLQLEFYYNQLVALSFGFQHAYRRGACQKDNKFLLRCYNAASRVVKMVVEELAPQKYMRYCPESHYIFSTFASAFLLKLLRPKFSGGLDVHHQHEILDLVERLIKCLAEIAMDDRHAPKLYSRFLNGLLKKAQKILARGTSSVSSPASTLQDPLSGNSPTVQMSDSFTTHDAENPNLSPSNTRSSYNMQDIQSAMPQHAWPYGIVAPGESDTLASMQFFGDQFWEDGLLPGFAWSGTGPTPANDNIIGDNTIMEQDLQRPIPTFQPTFISASFQ